MKKIISVLIAVIIFALAAPSAFAIEEKYTYTDLQKLYDTVVNYIFKTEDRLTDSLTDDEDLLCSKALYAAKLMLLSNDRTPEEINYAYNGLYSTFAFLMLVNQRDVTAVTAERLTLMKSLAAVTLTDDFYALVDEQRASETRNLYANAINVINESPDYSPQEVSESLEALYKLLYECAKFKINYYCQYFDILEFTDVLPNDWFYDAVSYVYNAGLFKGTSQSQFSPQLTMTRAMFITVLSRFAYAEGGYGESIFADVENGSYYAEPVAWAYENGILSWVDDVFFYPDAPITREEMFMCMYNYSRITEFDDSQYDLSLADKISDLDAAADIAADAVRWCFSTGVISGYGDNTVMPLSTATRAEVAQVFINFTDVMGDF